MIPTATERPPEPAERALLRAAELDAERLTARLRTLVGVLLLVGLALTFVALSGTEGSVRAAVQADRIVAAFLVLGAYSGIGAGSLFLLERGRFRPWMAWALTVADTAILCLALYSITQTSDLTVAYAAAFPPILLVPLLIGFTALRYDPRLVIFATVTVAVGLTALWVALPGSRIEGAAEINFLFGGPPNLMRLLMVVLLGLILAAAVGRARALLLRAMEEARRRATVARFLPPEVERHIEAGADTGGQVVEAAVLFADLRGFTALSESLDPRDLGAVLDRWRSAIQHAVGPQGGVIDKFIGDGALVVFGAPDRHPAPAEAAVRAARTLVADVAEWDAPLSGGGPTACAVSVHFGPVWSGVVGSDTRREFTVLGDTVNVAARIEEIAKAVDAPILMSAAVRDRLPSDLAGDTEAMDRRPLRGRSGTVDLFRLAGGRDPVMPTPIQPRSRPPG